MRTDDPTTNRKATAILAATVESGGCTFDARNLLAFAPATGYAVGVGGARLPAGDVTAEVIANTAYRVAQEFDSTYAGTWLDEGFVYIDAIRYFGSERRGDALACGRLYGQKAIFDFATQEAIAL